MVTATVLDEEEEVEVVVEKPPRFGKKRLLLIGGGILLLLLVGAIAAFLMLRAPSSAKKIEVEVPAEAFVDVPPITVNIRSTDGAARLIKLHVLLVPTSAVASEKVKSRLPLVIDAFQPFLRELRPEDLAGSAAVFLVKEELLLRANGVVGGTVKDVLIQDLIEQ